MQLKCVCCFVCGYTQIRFKLESSCSMELDGKSTLRAGKIVRQLACVELHSTVATLLQVHNLARLKVAWVCLHKLQS